MSQPHASSTSVTLLEHLRAAPADRAGWEEFVGRYAPKVRGWCRRWCLQEADVEDVTQVVLARIARGMATFRYDPTRSFRAYVKTLTRYAVSDLRAALDRPDVARGDSLTARMLEAAEAREDLEQHLHEEFDLELLREAMSRISRRVEPETWEAFRLVTEGGCSTAEAAARLGVKVAKVYVAKSRVLKLVRDELRALEAPDDDHDAGDELHGGSSDEPLPRP
jgi:RNA polymerase sigma-70 factor (ECF subfamily)